MNKVALVTGGSKSIGYAIGREIVKRIPSATCFMTSRENVSDYYSVILGLELGAGVRHRARFLQMDIRDEEEVSRHRDLILEQHGGLDILVNNDQVYLRPEVEQFPAQCRQVLATNYWGTKNVIRAFLPDLRADSRIVNITSNLAHVKSVISEQEMERKENARERFSRVESIAELDEVTGPITVQHRVARSQTDQSHRRSCHASSATRTRACGGPRAGPPAPTPSARWPLTLTPGRCWSKCLSTTWY